MSKSDQKAHINALTNVCNHTGATSNIIPLPSTKVAGRVSPDQKIGKNGGVVLAHIVSTPGNLALSATVTGMKYGTHRTLTCDYSLGGGSYSSCGSASDSGTSLSTRTEAFCPVPGLSVVAIAESNLPDGTSWYDDEYSVTK